MLRLITDWGWSKRTDTVALWGFTFCAPLGEIMGFCGKHIAKAISNINTLNLGLCIQIFLLCKVEQNIQIHATSASFKAEELRSPPTVDYED
jgi:hypothetical protein